MYATHFEDLTEEALNAFWGVIVKRFPQSVSGDLSPAATISLHMAAQAAVKEWIMNNVPPQLTE
jgi:hypothetical protein